MEDPETAYQARCPWILRRHAFPEPYPKKRMTKEDLVDLLGKILTTMSTWISFLIWDKGSSKH